MTKRIISIALVFSILLPLFLVKGMAQENIHQRFNDLTLIKSENLTGDFKDLRIEFSEPIKFNTSNIRNIVYASSGINGQDGIDYLLTEAEDNCKPVNAQEINGELYSKEYDLKFSEALPRIGNIIIKDAERVNSSDDKNLSAQNSDGVKLEATGIDLNGHNITEKQYVIHNRIISSKTVSPNKAVIEFNSDTKFVTESILDLITVTDYPNNSILKLYNIKAIDFKKLSSKEFEISFDSNLPDEGVINITENNKDDDMLLGEVAQSEDNSFGLAATYVNAQGQDVAAVAFKNGWLYIKNIEYVSPKVARITFNKKAVFSTTNPEILFRASISSAVGEFKQAKKVTPNEGSYADGSISYDVEFYSNIEKDCKIAVVGNIESNEEGKSGYTVYSPDLSPLFTDKTSNVKTKTQGGKDIEEKLGYTEVEYKILPSIISIRKSDSNKAILKFNMAMRINKAEIKKHLNVITKTSIIAASEVKEIDNRTYEVTFFGEIKEGDILRITESNKGDEDRLINKILISQDNREAICTNDSLSEFDEIRMVIRDYTKLTKAEIVNAEERLVRLSFLMKS